MARGRMIDKVIILSKKINAVSEGAENLYYRIYVSTDDFGLFHADPKILKGQAYTLRNVSIQTIKKRLNELIGIGLIKVYEIDGERYLKVIGFEKHQFFRKDYNPKHEYPSPSTKSYESVQVRTKSPTNINEIKLNKIKLNKVAELKKTIINYFNETTNQKRSYTCEETNKLINGRLNEGKTLKDFKHVIDTKTAQWLNNPEMRRYIRPSTLFRQGNFEDYLNEPYGDPKKKTFQVGVPRGQNKTKYPTLFLGNVYALLRKQGKDGNKYASLFFALTDAEAKAAAEKYKNNPAGFIKLLEENA